MKKKIIIEKSNESKETSEGEEEKIEIKRNNNKIMQLDLKDVADRWK